MKSFLILFIFIVSFSSLKAAQSDHFITTWDTTIASGSLNATTLKLAIMDSSYTYNFRVDWNNDGDFDDNYSDGVDESTYYTNANTISHNYATAGTYSIGIDGDFPRFKTANGTNLRQGASRLIAVEQWGTQVWKSFSAAFYKSNLVRTSSVDKPNLSQVTDMSNMFFSAKVANPDVSNWNVSNVTNMKSLFADARIANPDVSNWDVSNVTNMASLFDTAKVATPDVSNWDVSKVTTMSAMFRYAYKANPDVSTWDTSNVTIMERMFQQAYKATLNTTDWNTSKVTNMYFMFNKAIVATPDTSNWDTSSVTRIDRMFEEASVATPNTSNWDTSKMTNFFRMFFDAKKANPNTSNWNTSNVTSTTLMFYGAKLANPDTSQWQTPKLKETRQMFQNATSARPVVDSWDITNVTNMTDMFIGTSLPKNVYDAILLHFGSNINKKNNVSFHGGNAKYCEGAEARQSLLTDNTWSITDAGQDCFPDTPLVVPNLIDTSDLGNSNSDNQTNDNTPSFDVNCTDINNTIILYNDIPAAIGTHLCSEVGLFSLETNTTLADGTYNVTYTESRRGDVSLASNLVSIKIYTQIPTLTITSPIMLDDIINGTEEKNVTISGTTTAEVNQTVTIVIGTLSTIATVQADGTWSVEVDVSAQTDGTLNISANVSDVAGNAAGEVTDSVVKDTEADPITGTGTGITSPTISTDNNSDINGSCGTDYKNGIVTITTDEVNGFSPHYNEEITLDKNGSFNITGLIWIEGAFTLKVDCTDEAGNSPTTISPVPLVTIDATAPELTITSPIMLDDIINGTEEKNVTISGTTTAEVNQTVTIVIGTLSTIATVQADGTWSVEVDVSAQTDGTLNISANVSDVAGNAAGEVTKSIIKKVQIIIVDNIVPLISINNPIMVDNMINSAEEGSVIISGTTTAEANQIVYVLAGNISRGARVNSDGRWSILMDLSTLLDGDVKIMVNVQDIAGNHAQPAKVTIIKDTQANPIIAPETGINSPKVPTNNKHSDLEGSCGSEYGKGIVMVTTIPSKGFNPYYAEAIELSSDGSFSITGLTWVEGMFTLEVNCTDEAGNAPTSISPVPLVTIDATAPELTITSPIMLDDIINESEENNVTIAGTTTAEVNQTVTIVIGMLSTIATVQADGTWSVEVDVSFQADGILNIHANVSDVAGNTAGEVVDTVLKDTETIPVIGTTFPTTTDNNRDINGSCGIEYAKGTVRITTVEANGFSPHYNEEINLDENGSFNIMGLTWVEGTFTLEVNCTKINENTGTSITLVPVDVTAPELIITSPIMLDDIVNASEENAVTITGTTTAEENQLVSIEIGMVTTTATVQADGTWTVDIDVSGEDEGTLIIYVNVEDVSGNSAIEVITFVVKNTQVIITSTEEETNMDDTITTTWYEYIENIQASLFAHLEKNTTIASEVDLYIETLEEDNIVSIEYEYESNVDVLDNSIDNQCELVAYKAYLNIYQSGELKTGYIKKFLNCNALNSDTLKEDSVFLEGSTAQLKTTSEEEKETYGNSSMVIIIDTELSENNIIIGDL